MRIFFPFLPAVRLLAVAVTGILAAVFLPVLPVLWLAVSLAGALVTVIVLAATLKRPANAAIPPAAVVGYLLTVAAAFAWYASVRYLQVPDPSLLEWVGSDVLLSGVVEGRPSVAPSGLGFGLRVREVFHDGNVRRLDDGAKVFVRVPPGSDFRLEEGEFVRIKGRPGLIALPANRGEFDARHEARFHGVHVQLYCPGPWCILRDPGAGSSPLYRHVVNPARNYLAACIDADLPAGRERQFVKGMLLGEQDLLPEELSEAFRRTGTAHVIAVSGLHVALLALAVNLLLQRLKTRRAGRMAAFLLFVVVLGWYCLVTGNAPSIRRAAIMSSIMLGGGSVGRRSWSFNSLAASDLVILGFDPFDLFNAGFLMTNSAVVGILGLYGPLSRMFPEGRGIPARLFSPVWRACSVSLAAMAGVSPVIALMFGTFSLAGIVANLPVVFFSNLAMYSALPMFALHPLLPLPAGLFGLATWLFARLTLLSMLLCNRMPMASLSLQPTLFGVAVFYLTLLLLTLSLMRRQWGRSAIVLLCGANVLVWSAVWQGRPAGTRSAMVTVNLGKNVAVLFSSGSETVVVDAGRNRAAWPRVVRQAEVWGLPAPSAIVGFFSPDSVVAAAPVPRRLDAAGTALRLRTIVVSRQSERVVRIDSRGRSVLLVSGMARLSRAGRQSVDVAVIWLYRFTGKQWRELDVWRQQASPRQVFLVPGAFMGAGQRELLRRYARSRKGVVLRSERRQSAWF